MASDKRLATLADFRRTQMTTFHFEAQGRRVSALPHHRGRARARSVAGRLLATLRQWHRRARDRAELAGLDDRMLRDIGLTRADAALLSSKPFWRE